MLGKEIYLEEERAWTFGVGWKYKKIDSLRKNWGYAEKDASGMQEMIQKFINYKRKGITAPRI